MTKEARAQLMVWWILWGAFQVGILIMYQLLGGTGKSTPLAPADSPVWLVGFAPVVVSAIVRWVILPRATSAPAALPFFILGIAFAESALFLGLFLFPAHKQELFVLSALGIFQFIPLFARRFFIGDEPDSLRGS